MSLENQAVTILAQEMKKVAKTMIDNASFDKTVKGRITAFLGGKNNNKYLVMINNTEYEAISYNTNLSVNDIVFVTIVQNDYNNLLINVPVNKTNQADSWELETTPITV